jgi:small conductance mechanosensitive channel
MQAILERLQELALLHGPHLALAAIIAASGWILSRWAASAMQRLTSRSTRIDPTLAPILVHAARIAILVATGMAVLDRLGVDTASLLAVLGAIGLGVGLALKDTLADVAAGVAMLVLRPFDVGDLVAIDGESGQVLAIDIFETKLVDFSGVPFVLPNAKVRTAKISNFSRAKHRRCELTIGVAYEADVARAIEVLRSALDRHPTVLKEPLPTVVVERLADSSVELLIRFFVPPTDFPSGRGDVAGELKSALDAAGISIPFPQRVLHVVGGSPFAGRPS